MITAVSKYLVEAYRQGTLKPKKRSSYWPEVRKVWLKSNPTCAACGGILSVEVHHIQPFHIKPEFELDMSNFITLCEGHLECHLKVGHLGNWSNFNTDVIHAAHMKLISQL